MKYNNDAEMLNDALAYAKVHLKRSRKQIAKMSGVRYETIGLWSLDKSKPTSFMLKSVLSACGFNSGRYMEKK
jgi:hypothetical protein